MHDPLTVAFEIRRPWPTRSGWKTDTARQRGVRWEHRGAFSVVAGHGLYWPGLITVWHHDPSGYDTTTCPPAGRWRWHVHHWRIQILPLQQMRRRLRTRCERCSGRSTKEHPVDISSQWDGPRVRWWQPEQGLRHYRCP
ncbi:hypothetical protein [Streptomyces sp. NPDC056987]|uniref:hypothetical protein n=1 Tax=Streptomyces sp. NPDC056987 TaxID=3345988 RepID=UPI00363503B9